MSLFTDNPKPHTVQMKPQSTLHYRKVDKPVYRSNFG